MSDLNEVGTSYELQPTYPVSRLARVMMNCTKLNNGEDYMITLHVIKSRKGEKSQPMNILYNSEKGFFGQNIVSEGGRV